MPMAREHVSIHGKVQGVFFRASAKDTAHLFGVKGWIKNCFDGSVEAVFEGEKEAVDSVVNWCRKGPPGALVTSIDVEKEKYLGEFNDFSIVYSHA
ncbi:MAG: acylphosphatase [Candidatus Jettenia sp.]|nr:MAG: acylphosphatase [Candidatus Jettenia sp.]